MANIFTSLAAATGVTDGVPIAIGSRVIPERGGVAFQISGITDATVKLQAAIATERELSDGAAVWTDINGAVFSSDIADMLFGNFNYVRASVTAYTSGTITVKLRV